MTEEKRVPPVVPAYRWLGYVAGYANYHAVEAWGLTPEMAIRRWRRKNARQERKWARARAAEDR